MKKFLMKLISYTVISCVGMYFAERTREWAVDRYEAKKLNKNENDKKEEKRTVFDAEFKEV